MVAVGLIIVLCPLTVSTGQGALTGGPFVEGMHVRSLSHWAPANIGPYSQAISVRLNSMDDAVATEHDNSDDDQLNAVVTFYSGQIGLVPETLALIDRDSTGNDITGQCWLTLRHCHRVVQVDYFFPDCYSQNRVFSRFATILSVRA